MLVVKVEVWPHGYTPEAFEIARIGIDNRTPGKPRADYGVTALLGRNTSQPYVVEAGVQGHVREHGWEPLLGAALDELMATTASPAAGQGYLVKLLLEGAEDERVVLADKTAYVLEVEQEGVWRPFTADKTDPADVVRTYDFGRHANPDEKVRIVEVRTTARVVDRDAVQKNVKPGS